jgi:hypothetical protein
MFSLFHEEQQTTKYKPMREAQKERRTQSPTFLHRSQSKAPHHITRRVPGIYCILSDFFIINDLYQGGGFDISPDLFSFFDWAVSIQNENLGKKIRRVSLFTCQPSPVIILVH